MNLLKLKISNLKTYRLVPTWEVKHLLSDGCWLAGGALRTLVDKDDEINDFDFFFKSVEKQKEFQAKLLEKGFELVYECPLGGLFTYKAGSTKIQVICENYYSSPEELLKTFDFTVTCAATDGENLWLTTDFVRHIMRKELRLSNLVFPVATFKRVVKYANKGYKIREVAKEFCQRVNQETFEDGEMREYID